MNCLPFASTWLDPQFVWCYSFLTWPCGNTSVGMNLSQDFVYVNVIRFPSSPPPFLVSASTAVLALVTAFLAPLVPTLGGILFGVYLLIFNELMLEIFLVFLSYCENGLIRCITSIFHVFTVTHFYSSRRRK